MARPYQYHDDHVVLALPDLRAAHAFVGHENFIVMHAPVLHATSLSRATSRNFADMLLSYGFRESQALMATIDVWLALFETVCALMLLLETVATGACTVAFANFYLSIKFENNAASIGANNAAAWDLQ